MPFKWISKGRKKNSPDDVRDAVLEVVNENKKIRTTAKKYNIDKMTLFRYVKKYEKDKNIDFSPNFVTSQIFTSTEEQALTEYLLTSANLNYGLTPIQTRKFVYLFGKENHKKIPENWTKNKAASYDWLRGFMSRNSQLSLRTPEATSLSRATAFNKHNVNKFFGNLRSVYERERIGPESIYNVDETGVTTAHKPLKIIGPKGQKQVSKATSAERGSLVTVCCAINALGNSVPPFLIFPRVRQQDYMTQGAPPGSIAVAHESGWMTELNFVNYLDHFIKYVKCSIDKKCILILDNHESHITPKTINLCKNNGIVLLTLPPHTSHRLQPLDVSVYGPFKHFFNECADTWMVNHPGQTITLRDIPQLVGHAFGRAFVPTNIIKGFSTTGIYPYNPHVFSDADFSSAEVTNRPLLEATENDPHSVILVEPTSNETVPENEPESDLLIDMPTTHDNNSSVVFRSPEQIRPFPKAPPRKKKGGRKPGSSRILTDTPEKLAIEEEFKIRQNKKVLKKNVEGVKKNVLLEDINKINIITATNQIANEELRKSNRNIARKIYVNEGSPESDKYDKMEIENEDDDEDVACIYCNSLYSHSKPHEFWIKCQICAKWCHIDCAGITKSTKMFTCDICK